MGHVISMQPIGSDFEIAFIYMSSSNQYTREIYDLFDARCHCEGGNGSGESEMFFKKDIENMLEKVTRNEGDIFRYCEDCFKKCLDYMSEHKLNEIEVFFC